MILDYFPVLVYHKISPHKEFGLTTISPHIFETHLQIIKDEGLNSFTFTDLMSNKEIPKNPIIISFDDAYESVYEYAVPLMHKYNLKAVIFVLSDFIGKFNTWEAYNIQRGHRHLNAAQLKKLSTTGHEIASHGKTHAYLPVLNDQKIKVELTDSKKAIEDVTGMQVRTFCYPYGITSKRISALAGECGYQFAVGNLLLENLHKHNPLNIGRRSIYSTDSLNVFREKLKPAQLTHTSVFTEKIIRLGAKAGILKKILSNNLN